MRTIFLQWPLRQIAIISSESVGGVVCQNDGFINNCYNIGTVFRQDISGGVVGYGSSTVTNCNNKGTATDVNAAGGVVGNTHGVISNSYNSGAVGPNLNTGGVAGLVCKSGAITNIYNAASITDSIFVGGVVRSLIGSINAYYNTENNTENVAGAHSPIGNNNGSSSSVLGFTTLDMSGPDALNHMIFTDAEGI